MAQVRDSRQQDRRRQRTGRLSASRAPPMSLRAVVGRLASRASRIRRQRKPGASRLSRVSRSRSRRESFPPAAGERSLVPPFSLRSVPSRSTVPFNRGMPHDDGSQLPRPYFDRILLKLSGEALMGNRSTTGSIRPTSARMAVEVKAVSDHRRRGRDGGRRWQHLSRGRTCRRRAWIGSPAITWACSPP